MSDPFNLNVIATYIQIPEINDAHRHDFDLYTHTDEAKNEEKIGRKETKNLNKHIFILIISLVSLQIHIHTHTLQ